ncbi:MAG TPA: hypothetical protein VLY23_13215 [Candidatus Acidoferrum sp.]|nr:hypothetical protein [Candidatus Acidoferrum sp.]
MWFALSLPFTAIQIARRRDASLRFRRALVIKLLALFLLLVFAALDLAFPRSLFVWLAVVSVGLSVGASRYCLHVMKKELPEIARGAWWPV